MINNGEKSHIFPNSIFYKKGTTKVPSQNTDAYQKIILKLKLTYALVH